uniref:Uncharacterized protein n=1 Tax=Rhizobium leguminosarum bv. viciae TaxID=387 RepID=A0A0U3JAY9_RHILV|nr:hypothetical protein [Rhizobium leguminosarum bv. viciae]
MNRHIYVVAVETEHAYVGMDAKGAALSVEMARFAPCLSPGIFRRQNVIL